MYETYHKYAFVPGPIQSNIFIPLNSFPKLQTIGVIQLTFMLYLPSFSPLILGLKL